MIPQPFLANSRTHTCVLTLYIYERVTHNCIDGMSIYTYILNQPASSQPFHTRHQRPTRILPNNHLKLVDTIRDLNTCTLYANLDLSYIFFLPSTIKLCLPQIDNCTLTSLRHNKLADKSIFIPLSLFPIFERLSTNK